MSNTDTVLKMARWYLNDTGVSEIEQYLKNNDLELAQVYVFGAIDYAFSEKDITEEEYLAERERLGITQDAIDRARQTQ